MCLLVCHFPFKGLPGRPGLPGADGLPGPPGTVLMLPVSKLELLKKEENTVKLEKLSFCVLTTKTSDMTSS